MNQTYFTPALTQACERLGTIQPSFSQSSPNISNGSEEDLEPSGVTQKSQGSRSTQISQVSCPKCSQLLQKIPSKSKKLKANHFLKCATADCGVVMFWNPQKKRYELPYAQRTPDPQVFTEIPCPQCGAVLEKHQYQKDGQDKVMLRCSIFEHRKGKCKDVAFFQTQQGFWSPKFGVLEQAN